VTACEEKSRMRRREEENSRENMKMKAVKKL
jgi:hypothetical protein